MMSEFDKMCEGRWYDPADPELVELRQTAKRRCHYYNHQLYMHDLAFKQDFFCQLLPQLPSSTQQFEVVAPFWCDYGTNIRFGNNFFANHNVVILDCAPVVFGDNAFIGPNCGFYTAIHPMDALERATGMERAEPIQIGNNVWIGGGVQVLPGVTIGDNVVIGAGSVVTKSIPDNVVAVGNPCRVLREITESDKSGGFSLTSG